MNILVVDDNKFIREVVSAMIIDSGHIAVVANGHVQAMAALKKENIDLVLMDIEMPEVDGFALTKMIRKEYPKWFPIIFLSSNDSEEYLTQGIDAGADDYLTKPIKQVILSAKLRAMERITKMKGALERANKQLEILSSIDPLTQILNRRGLEEVLASAWQINERQQGELSILMIDIDFFKPYNDNYGHPQGDKCLVQVANTLNETLNRATDSLARYGGEEFIVVLPFTPVEGARFKAKELSLALLSQKIKHEYSSIFPYVTVSIGIATTSAADHVANASELIKQADIALYQAKDQGRNRSSVFQKSA
ncbi:MULTISPECIES: diguanylate cyclase [unclassified Colwellia]|uniref:GGDEF domain-containing protein n=1 Tax=unclassified Colwellia TaxID=196834 RepID=UPI0015F43ACA|nr:MULTISPECIES: diguanylate cyclase [unclassified Colwellia]MBA6365072.1 diguanylate cyclase [Colwellia sp. BRX8-8]MBA6372414.1 diguanylate cyclase [Colwellia sp. BRX8-4]MBA6379893.1 diguanylate cyclase [Colwellia sp. BRX10-7]MBA6386537.1 diguanylate cyclase [Colwellia sp. BRX10-2]MBA6401647.1 diguanylate cyclase [Colwellia sp. BRX10-5]